MGKRSKTVQGVTQEQLDNIFLITRCRLANEVRDNVERRIKQEVIPKLKNELRQEVSDEVAREAYSHFVALMANILLNHFGELNKKATRLKAFYKLLEDMNGEIEHPSQQQLEAEEEFNRQLGRKEIIRT